MKVTLIALFILIIPTIGYNQINQSIDFVGGIEYSFRHLINSSTNPMIVDIFDKRQVRESGKANWRVGLNYNRRLSNNVFLKTGLRLASVGYKDAKRTGLTWGSELDSLGVWTLDPTLPHEAQFIFDYWFAEIPIAGRFELNQSKFSPFFEIGISPSVFIGRRAKLITDLGTDVMFTNLNVNRLHLVGFLSFGMNYSLNDQLQLFGQPIFRYHFTKLADAPVGEYLFNYGIEIGIRKKLH